MKTLEKISAHPDGSIFRRSNAERFLDLFGAAILIFLLSPLILVVAVFIRTVSSGPIIFKQLRVGQNGRKFMMYKFRTMSVDTGDSRHVIYSTTLMRSGKPMAKLDCVGDSRLIPFGRFLRASGMDELPQLVNVFKNDMSLVGPRPCLPSEFEAYGPGQMKRFAAIPGITGLWQVSGKNDLTFVQMIKLDEHYIRNKSTIYNLYILLKTPAVLLIQIVEALESKAKNVSELSENDPSSELESKIAG